MIRAVGIVICILLAPAANAGVFDTMQDAALGFKSGSMVYDFYDQNCPNEFLSIERHYIDEPGITVLGTFGKNSYSYIYENASRLDKVTMLPAFDIADGPFPEDMPWWKVLNDEDAMEPELSQALWVAVTAEMVGIWLEFQSTMVEGNIPDVQQRLELSDWAALSYCLQSKLPSQLHSSVEESLVATLDSCLQENISALVEFSYKAEIGFEDSSPAALKHAQEDILERYSFAGMDNCND